MSKGDFSPYTLEMYAYGVYLMHGGDPERFEDLTMDQIQIMITSYMGTQKHIIDIFYKMFKAFRGIDDD